MYLVSHYAGRGRGLWASVDNGRVDIRSKSETIRIEVQHGRIVQQTTRRRKKCTTITYGVEQIIRKANKVVKEEYFEPDSLQAIRKGCLYKRQTDIALGGMKGTVECFSTSGGGRGKEVFTYDNSVIGYTATYRRKKLLLKRPDGTLWAQVIGRVVLSCCSIAERLDTKEADLGFSAIMRQPDWSVIVYAADGVTVRTQGQVKNRQRQDIWLLNGKPAYYLSGVRVCRAIYQDNPNKWNGYDILKITNAQLRCSLLARMGYDRLLEKVNPTILETSPDGGALLEIDTRSPDDVFRGSDRMMRMIKVICPSTGQRYILRVPPDIQGYEQARQWTFGLRQDSIRSGASFAFAKET